MNTELEFEPINTFPFDGKEQVVSFVETMKVADGVECDVYAFDGDTTKDLGIIKIKPGKNTPLQRVLKGDKTIEGHLSGKGRLVVTQADGAKNSYAVDDRLKEPFSITVQIGEQMQWIAEEETALITYEICFPPYEDGRYENIVDKH